jgi:molybdopterin-guanine dinucleotide biosynthesis protein A
MTTASIVLAGGRSSRMGVAKAELAWEGGTLLGHVTEVVAEALDGPVVVVRAPGQELPALGDGVRVVDDPHQGLGPLQGIAAGLAAVAHEADVAFVAATDMPFLRPEFARTAVAALRTHDDVAVPVVHGHRQPLCAAYRTALAPVAAELVAELHLRPGMLFARCRVRWLDEAALLADPVLAAADPRLESVTNVNTPAEYAAACARLQAVGATPA